MYIVHSSMNSLCNRFIHNICMAIGCYTFMNFALSFIGRFLMTQVKATVISYIYKIK